MARDHLATPRRLAVTLAAVAANDWCMQCPQTVALAQLLPLLQCGEDSAVLAFERLGRRQRRLASNLHLAASIESMAVDERWHARWLTELAGTLPDARPDPGALAHARRFFCSLASSDCGIYFTRIAAVDSAVCVLLGALRRAQPHLHRGALACIGRDEARHAAFATLYARALCPVAERAPVAEQTRIGLAALLRPYGSQFDALQLDPDRLLSRLARAPASLCSRS